MHLLMIWQCIAGQIIIIPEVYLGAGRHIEYIEPANFSESFKLNFITQPIYLWAIALVKIAVGFFLLRIAVRPFYRRLIIGIMGMSSVDVACYPMLMYSVFMGLYTFGCFLTIVLQCTDLRVMWDPTVKGTCWTTFTIKTLGYTNAGLNIFTDLAFSIFIPVGLYEATNGCQANLRARFPCSGMFR